MIVSVCSCRPVCVRVCGGVSLIEGRGSQLKKSYFFKKRMANSDEQLFSAGWTEKQIAFSTSMYMYTSVRAPLTQKIPFL